MTGSGTGSPSVEGQTLAQYAIRERMGDGESGPIYLARDTTAARDVLIEVFPPKAAVDSDRLRQEVKAVSALDHWNIAKTYEFATAGGISFVAREAVQGRTLQEALRAGPMDSAAALDCARQIAGALAAGHAIGVTHRHLHPANIVLTEQNRVKLVNFGLSVPVAPDFSMLAPEQLDGRGADARSDIYSFGVVLGKILGAMPPKPIEPIIARATRKDVARRYQLMDDVFSALERAAADPDAATKDHGHRMLVAAAVLVIAAIGIGWWILGGRSAMNQGPVRLTSDSGLTTEGAIAANGHTVVYASDRASAGVLNLWTQPVSGGNPSRLTQGPDDDHQPSISPDGARVVFRSERDGGGIYTVAAAGGTPQLLMKGGRNPRFSPDGRWIAYWSGDPLQPGAAGIWVLATSGGQPVRIQSQFADARAPVWSADGKRILFVGHEDMPKRRGGGGDWYVATFENGTSAGKPTRTGAGTLLHMQAIGAGSEAYYGGSFAIPEAWAGGQVLFSGRMTPMGKQSSGQPRLLRIPISSDIMQATGAAHELTSGADWDSHPSLSAGNRVVYSRREMKSEIWSVAADGSGGMQRMTEDTGDVRPAVSGDGKRLAYRVPQSDGSYRIRVIEAEGRKQIANIRYNSGREWPVLLSSSGDELVYSEGGLRRVQLPSGSPERIRGRGFDQATSWSSDGKYLLVQRGWRSLGVIDTTTGRDRELFRDDRYPMVEARFSPDDKWIAYTLVSEPRPRVFIAEFTPEAARIAVSDDDTSASSPAWSAKGDQIYFVTPCQGSRCIWSRKLDPRSKKPLGEPFALRHFHGARYSLVAGIEPQNVGLVAAGDKLIFGMFETTGNIWSLPSLPRP